MKNIALTFFSLLLFCFSVQAQSTDTKATCSKEKIEACAKKSGMTTAECIAKCKNKSETASTDEEISVLSAEASSEVTSSKESKGNCANKKGKCCKKKADSTTEVKSAELNSEITSENAAVATSKKKCNKPCTKKSE